MKTITVFGGTRGVGLSFVEQARAAGHRVNVLARKDTAGAILGDATDPAAVAKALRGADAVVISLGTPARDKSMLRSRATQIIVDEMRRQGISRLVCLSAFGAAESRHALPLFTRFVVLSYLGPTMRDHEAQERIVTASDLAWTIVRPPYLLDQPHTGVFEHGYANDFKGVTHEISRADVADFMLREIETAQYPRRIVPISYAA